VVAAGRPEGPYRDSGRPLVTGGPGFEAIDPMVFTDRKSGRTYLYAGGSAGARLRVWQLKPDMVSIAREIPAVPQPPNFTEGAFMHERGGSHTCPTAMAASTDPIIRSITPPGPSPVGPWRYRGATLTSDARHQGRGIIAVKTPDGRWLIVITPLGPRGRTRPVPGRTVVAIDRIGYTPDGGIRRVTMTGDAAPTLSPRR
jgi:hypothetical protein